MGASRLLAIFGLITIGVVSRLIPHPPNFTSINAIALFGSLFLGNRWISLATLASTLFLSDMILGFHSTQPFVYLSFSLVIVMGYSLKEGTSLKKTSAVCFASSLLFFLITNLGVWTTDSLYPKTLSGLGLCYIAAVPFFVNQLAGDLAYSSLLFGFMSFITATSKRSINREFS